MWRASTNSSGLILALSALLVVLAILSLMIGPAGLSPRAALAGLIDGEGTAGIIVRSIRLPRTLLALLIGATLGLSGAALQGLLRNPLAEPALFGAPQAAAAGASFVIAYGLARRDLVRGAVRRHSRRAGFDRRPGRDRRPPREPHGDAAGRSRVRELRGRRDRAHPQPRAHALRGARNRVLAARLARRPQHGARVDRAAVLRRLLAAAVPQHAGLSRAHARRGRRGLARRRHRPHPADGGDRRGARRRRGGRGRGLDRLHRAGRAASGAARGRLRPGAGLCCRPC